MVQEASGTTIGLSATLPTTYDSVASTGYPSLTFTAVGEITDIPAFGESNNTVTHNPLGEIDVEKRPGSRNYGDLTLPMALDAADAGQVLILANLRSKVAIEITMPDGAVHYTAGYLMGFSTNVGGSDSIISASVTIAVTNASVIVAA